jgi:hypothetical protein
MTLDDLMRSAAPLLNIYLEAQAKEQERALAHEEKFLAEDGRRHRTTVIASVVVLLAILSLAALQVWRGRDDAAMDMIQLVITAIGAGFGGWGIAVNKAEKDESNR